MKILFHHIAKTAGTSLIDCLLSHFKERACPVRYDFELSEEKMLSAEFEFYHGHFSFDKVHEFRELNPDAFVFTFIRNPLNRVISQYFNWIDEGRTIKEFENISARGGMDSEKVRERVTEFRRDIYGRSLTDFLVSESPSIREVVANHQMRYLSPKSVHRADLLRGTLAAYENLQRFYNFVGLTEWYGLSLQLLGYKLGLPTGVLSAEIVRNTNAEKKEDGRYRITSEERRLLLDQNQFDLAVFSFAIALFRRRYDLDDLIEDKLQLPIVRPVE